MERKLCFQIRNLESVGEVLWDFVGRGVIVLYTKKLLPVLLETVSGVTFLNLLILYWIPIYVPLCSFSAIRLETIAFIEK